MKLTIPTGYQIMFSPPSKRVTRICFILVVRQNVPEPHPYNLFSRLFLLAKRANKYVETSSCFLDFN